MNSLQASATQNLRALLLAATLVALAPLLFVPPGANDFWLQVKIGEMIVTQGAIPRTVLFPFTEIRDNAFNAHEWLSSVLFYELEHHLGHPALLFVLGGLGLCLFALSVWLVRRRGGGLAQSLLLGCMAMLVANYRHILRPEILGLVLLLGLFHLLEGFRQGRRGYWLAWSLPLVALWANLHGSFVLAPVLASLFALGAAGDALRAAPSGARLRAAWAAAGPYGVAGAGMLLATLANPFGIELLQFALGYAQSSTLAREYIHEWTPTFAADFRAQGAFYAWLACVAITLGCCVKYRKRVAVLDVVLIGAFGALAATRNRYVVYFGFVAAYVLAGVLPRLTAQVEQRLRVATLAAAVVLCVLAVRFGNFNGAYPYYTPSSDFSEGMKEALSRPEVAGNVLNSYELGAELIYRYYPRLRPFIDSRIDSYGDPYYALWIQLRTDEAVLRGFLAHYDVRYMLLARRDFEVIHKMKILRDGSWVPRYADTRVILFERVDRALSRAE